MDLCAIACGRGKIKCMDASALLQRDGHWRMAVWTLRVGYVVLTIVLIGLILTLLGGTPWVLAVGVVVWLMCATIILTGFLWSRHDLPEPRPDMWAMRIMLIHDTVHARS